MSQHNYKAAPKRQELYCQQHHIPLFAPKSGICWACGLNIYYPYEGQDPPLAYTVEQAGKTHITGCPYCGTSFCD